jgi:thioesterase domain-containing protein
VLSYAKVSRHLAMPVYGVQAVRDDVGQALSVEALARRYVDVVRAVQAKGPYRLCGWSGGGIFAYELARQLLAGGEAVEFIGMIDSTHPLHVAPIPPFTEEQRQWQFLKLHTHYLDHDLDEQAVGVLDRLGSLDAAVAHCRQAGWLPPGFTVEELAWRTAMFTQFGAACVAYRPPPLPIPVHLFTAEVAPGKDPSMGWAEVAGASLRLALIGGDHFTIVEEPLAGKLGAAIDVAIEAAIEAAPANAPRRSRSALDPGLLAGRGGAGRSSGGSTSRT